MIQFPEQGGVGTETPELTEPQTESRANLVIRTSSYDSSIPHGEVPSYLRLVIQPLWRVEEQGERIRQWNAEPG